MSYREPKDPYEQGRMSFGLIASAAVLALIVVVGTVMYFVSGDDETQLRQRSSGGVDGGEIVSNATGFAAPDVDVLGRRVDIPNNPAGQPLAQSPGLQRKPSDKDWLTAPPAGTTSPGGWQRVFGVSVPFSTSDGPSRLEDGLAVGYAHTPQGAALAAAQIVYRLNARPADERLFQRQLRVGPTQQQAYEKAVAEDKLPQQQPASVTRYLVATDAFRLESYADDLAIVRLAGRGVKVGPQQTWTAIRLIMVWDAGDWRLKPANPGGVQTEYITSLVGWTQW